MFYLPQDILREIYSFDGTYQNIYKNIVQKANFEYMAKVRYYKTCINSNIDIPFKIIETVFDKIKEYFEVNEFSHFFIQEFEKNNGKKSYEIMYSTETSKNDRRLKHTRFQFVFRNSDKRTEHVKFNNEKYFWFCSYNNNHVYFL